MKILFIATAYKRHERDIITPWMVELIRRLRGRKIDVQVFASSYRGLKNQVIDGVPIIRFRYFLKKYERLTHEENAVDRLGRGPLNLLLSFFYIIGGSIAIYSLTRRENYDIVHVHWPFPHILFGLIAKYSGRASLFATFYGLEITWLKKKFRRLTKPFAWLLKRADIVSAISSHTAKELKTVTDRPIPIIPFSTPINEKTGAGDDQGMILFVGRSVERKGVDYLIRAFGQIKDLISHRLVIVGDGPERSNWEKLARSMDPGGRIVFTGWISNQELAELYRVCTFLVLPAVYDKHGDTEGLGVVLIEAMSYSKPVIASRVGGITDIVVDGQNGILVPPGDIDALSQAMLKIINDRHMRRTMGESAKKVIDGKFNWDRIIDDLIRLYERIDRKQANQ